MNAHYIYLNYYSYEGKILLYVGSHTWNGPEGQVDPSYHGSSSVAKRLGLKPFKIKLLEVVKDSSLSRESEVILDYMSKYGIADIAFKYSQSEYWRNKWQQHGLMLNCQANDLSHCMDKSRTPEVRAKASIKANETKMKNGTSIPYAALSVAHSPEVRAKAVKTMQEKGYSDKQLEAWSRPRTKEWMDKMIATKRELGLFHHEHLHKPEVHAKCVQSLRKNSRRCRLSDGFEGNSYEIEQHTGLPHGTVTTCMTRAFICGEYTMRSGLSFTAIYDGKERVHNSNNYRKPFGDRFQLSDGFEGKVYEIAEHLNMPRGTASSYAHCAKQQGTFVTHKGKYAGIQFTYLPESSSLLN